MNECWRDDEECKRLYDDLIEMISGFNDDGFFFIDAIEIVQTIKEMPNRMYEHHCFQTSCHRLFMYDSIAYDRYDILKLLLIDERPEDCVSIDCRYLFEQVLEIVETRAVERILCGETSFITAERLHDLMCSDILAAVEHAYVNNYLDIFNRFVLQDKELNKNR